MSDSILNKNFSALEQSGQHLALDWLRSRGFCPPVELILADDGSHVLVVNGQSQASRRSAKQEAESWLNRQQFYQLPEDVRRQVCLFGLGNPYIALEMLQISDSFFIMEPNREIWLYFLQHHDLSLSLLKKPHGLTVLTPWHLAEDTLPRISQLLVHQPAQRREAGHLSNLDKAMAGARRNLAHLSGRNLKIMLIPPLSGGSWPIAVSTAKAVERSGHELIFVQWPQDLKNLELEAQTSPTQESLKITAKLFQMTGSLALEKVSIQNPDLILSLAQAPLDAVWLSRIRQNCEAPLAFWLVEDYRNFFYIRNVAPVYDAFFHIQLGFIEPVLRDWGIKEAWYLPMAADPMLFQPLEMNPESPYAADLSFMGAGYPNRRRLFRNLAVGYWPLTGRPDSAFKIFGSGWSGEKGPLENHFFEKSRRVDMAECSLIYAYGQVNLNIHSSMNTEPLFDPTSAFVNPRTFEIAAAGALQIVDERPLLADLFKAGEELISVHSPDDLPDRINYFLENPHQAKIIGANARKKVLARHTYQHRLESLLSYLGWRGAKTNNTLN